MFRYILWEFCQRLIAIIILVIISPFFLVLTIIIILSEGFPAFFRQERMGKDGKVFKIWKFRTMKLGAEKEQKKYWKLNESTGPVFKLRNDPRYTKVGKLLSWSGLDEFPQLINVINGEMLIVGPRPLPVKEAENVPAKYQRRLSVKPGITSSWVVAGSHKVSFQRWMELDLQYIKERSVLLDWQIMYKTTMLLSRIFWELVRGKIRQGKREQNL